MQVDTDVLEIVPRPSPNFNDRPANDPINILVMHYTGMRTAEEALERLCLQESQVSAHYTVDIDGTVYQHVEEKKRAWHAGISCWRGRSSLNDTSIGIEIVNPGHEFGYVPFADEQMASVLELARDIIERYDIPLRNVIGHSDISPNRKEDPGELFDWKGLAWEGVGLWPQISKNHIKNPTEMLIKPGQEGSEVSRIQQMLQQYGYHIRDDGVYGPKTEIIVKAFKRHFVPEYVNVVWDGLAEAKLTKLIDMISDEDALL